MKVINYLGLGIIFLGLMIFFYQLGFGFTHTESPSISAYPTSYTAPTIVPSPVSTVLMEKLSYAWLKNTQVTKINGFQLNIPSSWQKINSARATELNFLTQSKPYEITLNISVIDYPEPFSVPSSLPLQNDHYIGNNQDEKRIYMELGVGGLNTYYLLYGNKVYRISFGYETTEPTPTNIIEGPEYRGGTNFSDIDLTQIVLSSKQTIK